MQSLQCATGRNGDTLMDEIDLFLDYWILYRKEYPNMPVINGQQKDFEKALRELIQEQIQNGRVDLISKIRIATLPNNLLNVVNKNGSTT